ncbi:MAG: hypothetical protein GY839_11855 [candidate division Zixibacteria bacterium]|nr:hypothetical protein [candidate division Zixibacteria bacterium]
MLAKAKALTAVVMVVLMTLCATIASAQEAQKVNQNAGDVSLDVITSVPRSMTFQGRINRLDDTFNITFSLWDHPDVGSGTEVWSQFTSVTTGPNGHFKAVLDNLNLTFDEQLYLQKQVEGDIPMNRIALTTVPYAAFADTADYARTAPGSGNSGWVDDGTVVRLVTETDSVGIGTSSPQALLQVVGTAEFLAGVVDVRSSGTCNAINGYNSTYENEGWVGSSVSGLYGLTDNEYMYGVLGDNTHYWTQGAIGGEYGLWGYHVNSGNEAHIGGELYAGLFEGDVQITDNLSVLNNVTVSTQLTATALDIASFRMNNSPTAGYVLTTDGAGYGTWQQADGSGWVDDGSVVRLETANDSVGIGTASPSERLEVDGNLKVTGKANIGPGNSNIGSNAFAAGSNNNADGDYSVISGGRENTADDDYASVGGGMINSAGGNGATISGGLENTASAWRATISGGELNTASSNNTTIGGGHNNTASANDATVAGGRDNKASYWAATVCGGGFNTASQHGAIVGGGEADSAKARYSGVFSGYANVAGNEERDTAAVICGGYMNTISSQMSAIGGGRLNVINAAYSVISGGQQNNASNSYSTIGGGYINNASGLYSTISGGSHNNAWGERSTIGGGRSNNVYDYGSTIGGGRDNLTSDSAAFVGGGMDNSATAKHATVSGGKSNTAGGSRATVGGGWSNEASGNISTIGGGYNNTAGNTLATVSGGDNNAASGITSTVSGGYTNTASGFVATVGGGEADTAKAVYSGVFSGYSNLAGDEIADTAAFVGGGKNNSANAKYTTVSGGQDNTANGEHATISGGKGNETGYDYATVGGGSDNTASAWHNTISGGNNNTTSNYHSSIGGGQDNTASGDRSIVGGGYKNTASHTYTSVGGGYADTAKARYSGVFSGYSNLAGDESSDTAAFVGGGYNNSAIAGYATVAGGKNNTASGINSFIGGGIDNNCAGDYSAILGGQENDLTELADRSMAFGLRVNIDTDWTVAFFSGQWFGRFGVNRDLYDGGINYPVHVGTHSLNGYGARLTFGGTWTNSSSHTFKENFLTLDRQQLLSKISSLSVESWNYKDSDEKHIGPMAEGFVAAFDVGSIRESDGKRENQYLAASDVAGVALAGVQALLERIEELEKENAVIKQLEVRIAELEAKVK